MKRLLARLFRGEQERRDALREAAEAKKARAEIQEQIDRCTQTISFDPARPLVAAPGDTAEM